MRNKLSLTSKEFIFFRAPIVQDLAIEFGVDDLSAINAMYELYCKISDVDPFCSEDDENYQDGYKAGYNDAIEECENMVDSTCWEIGRLKKN